MYIIETSEVAYTVYQQLDKKLVIASSNSHHIARDFFLLRCHPNGIIDTTFAKRLC